MMDDMMQMVAQPGRNNNQGQIGNLARQRLPQDGPVNQGQVGFIPPDMNKLAAIMSLGMNIANEQGNASNIKPLDAAGREKLEQKIKNEEKVLQEKGLIGATKDLSLIDSVSMARSYDRISGMYAKLGDNVKAKKYSEQSKQQWEAVADIALAQDGVNARTDRVNERTLDRLQQSLRAINPGLWLYNPAVASLEKKIADRYLAQAQGRVSPFAGQLGVDAVAQAQSGITDPKELQRIEREVNLSRAERYYTNANQALRVYDEKIDANVHPEELASIHLQLAQVAFERSKNSPAQWSYLDDAREHIIKAGNYLPVGDKQIDQITKLAAQVSTSEKDIPNDPEELFLRARFDSEMAKLLTKHYDKTRTGSDFYTMPPPEPRPIPHPKPDPKPLPELRPKPDPKPRPHPKPHPGTPFR